MSFGSLLRQFRIRAGLSQSDLAERASMSTAAVSALERGERRRPYPHTVSLLADALGLKAADRAEFEAARKPGRVRPAETLRHNLPAERTSFVGRATDIARICGLLRRGRFVTVTGSGGVGKTRMAIEVARQLLATAPRDTWFVDLAPLADGDFIAATIAASIQPSLSDRAETLAALVSVLANREMLLIVDNCEHLAEHAARVIDGLLDGCPRVSILATGREPLDVMGEFVYRLPSLPVPPAGVQTADARNFASVDLFVQRAEAAGADSGFAERDMAAICAIVRRLDGIPLAIELASAHVPVLGVGALYERVDRHLALRPAIRDLPQRQQTVDATIRWSYDLLAPSEQQLLCDAATFAGGFTFAAIEHVYSDETEAASAVLAPLAALVKKSLVHAESVVGGTRYMLLESVRAFALQRLSESGRYEAQARRHLRWAAAYADASESGNERFSSERLAEFQPELANLRSAVVWGLAATRDDQALAGRILCAFWGLWMLLGRNQEFRQLVELAATRVDESVRYYEATYASSLLLLLLRMQIMIMQQEPACEKVIERAIDVAERTANALERAKLYSDAVNAFTLLGLLDKADAAATRGAACFAVAIDPEPFARPFFMRARAGLRLRQGRFDEARADVAAAQAGYEDAGDHYGATVICPMREADIEFAAGNLRRAIEIMQDLAAIELAGTGHMLQNVLPRLFCWRLIAGDRAGAFEPLRQYLSRVARVRAYDDDTREGLEYVSHVLAASSDFSTAARFRGWVVACDTRRPFVRSVERQRMFDETGALLHEGMSSAELTAELTAGARLDAEDAIDDALLAIDGNRNENTLHPDGQNEVRIGRQR